MDAYITCKSINVITDSSKTITVHLFDFDKNEILGCLTKEDVMEHFDLIEKED